MTNQKTRRLVQCALFAALLAVCSQLVIPLPEIPINLALFAVHLAGAALGWQWGTASVIVYIALGAFGVPVFAGFKSGPTALFGPTGGYILGYVFDALIVGLWSKKLGRSIPSLCAGMVLGVAVCYAFGTAWFMQLSGRTLMESLALCVFPFLLGDAVKIALAAVLANILDKQRVFA